MSSDKCGSCRRKVSQGVCCDMCSLWFHWDCAGTNSDSVKSVSEWHCKLCIKSEIVKGHEETILDLRTRLQIALDEVAALKLSACSCYNKSPTFEVVCSRKRRARIGPSSLKAPSAPKVELSNRFNALAMSESEPSSQGRDSVPMKELVKQKKKVLVLGSSHARGVSDRLQETLGSEYAVTSIFKPNACLGDVVGDLNLLTKDLNKEDHLIIVGGAGNSLDRDLNFSIEKDINNIARKSSHTNVGFVNLLHRHDRPWMNRHVRNVNLFLDLAMLGSDMAHMSVIDTVDIPREHYTSHGLHLNARGKDSIVRLIAANIGCRGVDYGTKIPVVVRPRVPSFLG